jgi:NAD(P)-dependent dehydrogenase (short-subunit alcohol dehydrogenase family)
MKDVPEGERIARFRAVIVVVHPDGSAIDVEGTCEGVITEAPVGEGGFGYDPVFFLPEREVTMAQLTPEEVNEGYSYMHALPISGLQPVDIANQVLFFASDESRYLTGTTAVLDAGGIAPFKIPHNMSGAQVEV